jgi:predicted AAA+ superfamily ATPase
MERTILTELEAWKDAPHRKPLILNGARQVGKTWVLQELGRRSFGNVAYVNFDEDSAARDLFEGDYDIGRLIAGLQIATGVRIDPATTLVILDEIKECPRALTSLKYFNERAPEYAVACAGSLLGVSLHEGTGYPVGKVRTIDMHPLDFGEFLSATGDTSLAECLASSDLTMARSFRSRLVQRLRQYYYVGGMPEVVRTFADGGDYAGARSVQEQIVSDYQRDFSKHLSLSEAERVYTVWNSIPGHLAQENKKFVFGRLRKGARSAEYESALTWLRKAGLITLVPRVSKPGVPLRAYSDGAAFKVFLLDVGLLGAMAGLDAHSLLEGDALFSEFSGALTEQYVCQQLVGPCDLSPFYWSAENSSGEVDFLVQRGGKVYPIEVKAEENLRARSLRALKARHPDLKARRFSMADYREEEWMVNVPLYAIGNPEVWA